MPLCQGGGHVTVSGQKGRYLVRLATDAADLVACQALRHRCFLGGAGVDADRFDPVWQHMMVHDGGGGPLVCTFRFKQFETGQIPTGYAGQFYGLDALAAQVGPHIEIGRFCVDPGRPDPHILRVAWGALTQIVDLCGASILFGCTSFAGIDPEPYGRVLAALHDRYQGPKSLMPSRIADGVIGLDTVDAAGGAGAMPPLLRTYLGMGGWVGDHAVVDRHMQTLHVLTVVEIAKIPAARARALRALV